jgi:hypothetical protein
MNFYNRRNRVRAVLLATAVCSVFAQVTSANAATLAMWTFEAPPADANGALYPNLVAPEIGTGNARGVHQSAATTWTTPAGNGSANSFSSNNWAVGDFYEFSTSTLGFSGVSLSWDQASSNTGPRHFKLAYSFDGATFTDFIDYSVLANASPNPVWNSTTSSALYSFGQDLSGVTALDNRVLVTFRLIDRSTTSANGGIVASAGTDRVDNFTIMAAPVPEPDAYVMMLAGLSLLGLVARRRRR